MPPTLILVTGQHRSGTSATAGCLHQLGVHLGNRLMPATYANKKGHFEDLRVVGVHDRLLEALGARWDFPAIPTDWLEQDATRMAEQSLRGILRGFMAEADLFAIKDPRAALFVPMWHRLGLGLGCRLVILSPQRKEPAVINSLRAREGWLEDRALNLVRAYERAAQDWPRDVPVARINFPADLWMAEAWERVAVTLGVDLDLARIGRVHAFMDGDLVHHG